MKQLEQNKKRTRRTSLDIPRLESTSSKYAVLKFSLPVLSTLFTLHHEIFPNADFLSFTFGTIPAFALGFGLSFLLKFSEELIVGDDGWSIQIN